MSVEPPSDTTAILADPAILPRMFSFRYLCCRQTAGRPAGKVKSKNPAEIAIYESRRSLLHCKIDHSHRGLLQPFPLDRPCLVNSIDHGRRSLCPDPFRHKHQYKQLYFRKVAMAAESYRSRQGVSAAGASSRC